MVISKNAFSDKPADSQATFRHILTSMSEPGVISTLTASGDFGNMPASMAAIGQTLADATTSIYLSPSLLVNNDTIDNIKFYIESSITDKKEKSDFAFINYDDLESSYKSFDNFSQGNHEYPELSATIIVGVDSFEAGQKIKMTGPGIEVERIMQLGNVSSDFLEYLVNRAPKFPLGLDFIFTCGNKILCLPKTTKLEIL